MQTNLNLNILKKISFLTGDAEMIQNSLSVGVREPFNKEIIDFLNDVSKEIMSDPRSRHYSDIATFAFWIRRASVNSLKKKSKKNDGIIRYGRGIVFHIAPSNVPVIFAYSLVSGLLNGNINIVRVPSKSFVQIDIISNAFNNMLKKYSSLKDYLSLVRYEKEQDINDLFSSIADVRIIWGGDETIRELRKSPLPPRSTEITFSDRYSLTVIDSDIYLSLENKKTIANDFYNDTFLVDQNACSSPRIIIWTGDNIKEAKKIFWEIEHSVVIERYSLQAIQAVNKLTSLFKAADAIPGSHVEKHEDNLIIRISIPYVSADVMNFRDNSGFFFEYDCKDIMEIKDLCDDKKCQTLSYLGDNHKFIPLIKSGIKGIDRIVPIGRTMDFDLIWDGYDLSSALTRTISII